MTNKLFYGDNLDVLRDEEHYPSASVDLIYLDPPFNSNASYNILFKSPAGAGADASIEAFDDTWTWGPAASGALLDITGSGNHNLHTLMQAMKTAIGENAMMAYLAMMAVRLVELHRVLKPTGSLYLHCDPTASHYLKLVLDAVFGAENFRNEIVWKRTFAHGNVSRAYGDVTDAIFFYTKSNGFTWNQLYTRMDAAKADRVYSHADPDGRRWQSVTLRNPGVRPNLHFPYTASNGTTYQPHPNGWSCNLERLRRYDQEGRLHFPTRSGGALRLKMYEDESEGARLQSLWDDIPPISSNAQERLGYPTQKPIALLERIIATSSNPGDIVLDPFCGCGTAIDAAQKLGREWIGIDVTHLAIGLVEKRLRDGYGDSAEWETIGAPKDLASAQKLAADDPHQFQHWITLKLGGYPWMGGKKGGDKGVDGYFYYLGVDGATQTGVISVKTGGNVNPAMVRDLGRVMARDGHKLGVFVTAKLPTRGMEEEANSHGLVEIETAGRINDPERFPALQLFTLAELFQDRRPKLPPLVSPNRRAARVEIRASHKAGAQGSLI